ncbi:CAP domain-containing protein [Alteromonas sp. H39]|uniref:CAP domain-containing protein n=1 Tax=Alteromonas sp. H39 TaxID=3389876 RepID=UPI0039DF957A
MRLYLSYNLLVAGLLLLLNSLSLPAHAASVPDDIELCGNSDKAMELAIAIIEDPAQQRPEIRCNGLLTAIAVNKAKRMAEEGIVFHNLGGSPNSRLREAGFQLPEYYGDAMSNQVEAIAGGYATVYSVWRAFKNSETHSKHLLGKIPFYQEQDEMGIAFVKDLSAPHVEYWVVYLTKGRIDNQHRYFEEIPNKGIDIVTELEKPAFQEAPENQ